MMKRDEPVKSGPERMLEGPIVGSRSSRLVAVGSLLLALHFILACKACGPSLEQIDSATVEAAGRAHRARDEAWQESLRRSRDLAAQLAQNRVHEAVERFDPASSRAYAAVCSGWLDQGARELTRQCIDDAAAQGIENDELRRIEARLLMAEARFEEARELLFRLRDSAPEEPRIRVQLMEAFAQDPIFMHPVETLESGNQIDQIRALGGGSTLTMKLKLAGETIAAFKPNQTRRQSNYRAEVAAFRLCPILRCRFEIPYSFEVRIEQRAFMRMYGIASLSEGTGYAANFGDLIWTREDGSQFLYGVWKDWVPHFTEFPIEYDDVWLPWLSTEGDPALLEQPLAATLTPLRGRDRGNYEEILAEAGTATTYEMARQISNMLVFDFLINNWDRFSGAYYGVNCQWADGRFVSIDNGAGFMTRNPLRPRERLHQVSRFSASMVREVRELDRQALLPILFPQPTAAELEQFGAFEERIDEFLEYLDRLIEERGQDAVLFFE